MNSAPPNSRSWRIVHSEASLGWGGQERRTQTELEGFRRRGSQVWLLAPPNSQIFQRMSAAGVSCQPIDFARGKFPFAAFQAARWLRRIRPDVVNTHSSRDGWLVGVAARLARVPLLIRTRHIDVEYPNRWLSRHAYATFADHVLTTSDRITKHFQEIFNLPDDRISTISTGIDLQKFSPAGEKAVLVERGDRPHIGMVCVLRSWKGHNVFLDAAALLQKSGFRAHYVLVGEGPARAWVERLIAERALGDWVTLTGNRDDVPAVLRALDLLVIPSTKNEGIPQIGLQALATKTPVVGSDVGGIPEIIRPGETGRIFPGGDAAALATAIRETFSQPELTQAARERGRAMTEVHNSIDVMLDKLDALYARRLSCGR